VLDVWLALTLTNSVTVAQQPKPAQVEMAHTESTFKITAERNVVVVRVVARDPSGKAVTGLHREDFRLFDNGKLQSISSFSVETPEAKGTPATSQPAAPDTPGAVTQPEPPVVTPDRFVALYFDDLHIAFDDLARTRDAAHRYISTNLRPADGVGLFTASGVTLVDFTADRQKLRDAFLGLRQQPMAMMGGGSQNAQQGTVDIGSTTPGAINSSELASRATVLALQQLCRRGRRGSGANHCRFGYLCTLPPFGCSPLNRASLSTRGRSTRGASGSGSK